MKIYGYCRVSTPTQNIERQERNIKALYSDAIIIKEAFTGTKIEGRKEFKKLLKMVKSGDTIVFDSVSRMSRNAEDGVKLYFELYDKGINLVFLKEQYINTEVYASQLKDKIELTGEIEDYLFEGINAYFRALAARQIRISFDQSEKEVKDLQQRTKEGIETARLNGKQIGGIKGKKLTTKKSIEAKDIIRKHSISFGGSLSDEELQTQAKISRNTLYKYKREIREELQAEQDED